MYMVLITHANITPSINNHYNPEASAYNALKFCKRISIMLAIFYCIKISQTTKKKKNNFKKMYELFPNKEVLKYNHILV